MSRKTVVVFYGPCSLKGEVIAQYLSDMVEEAGLDVEVVSAEINSFTLWEGRCCLIIVPHYPPYSTSAKLLVEPLAYANPHKTVLEELAWRVVEFLKAQVGERNN